MRKILDLTGKRFSRLVVIGPSRRGKWRTEWLCRCDCGTEKWASSNDVTRGKIRSCGCLLTEWRVDGRIKSLAGKQFGRLLVLNERRRGKYRTQWLCICSCGSQKWITETALQNGRTRSCGCLRTPRSPEGKRLGKNMAAARYRERHPDRVKAYDDLHAGEWARKNPGRKRAQNALRKRKIKQATPPWADLKAIEQIYIDCPEGMHVHHKIPIMGITLEGHRVSGLHIPENLEPVPAEENLRIYNKYLGY